MIERIEVGTIVGVMCSITPDLSPSTWHTENLVTDGFSVF